MDLEFTSHSPHSCQEIVDGVIGRDGQCFELLLEDSFCCLVHVLVTVLKCFPYLYSTIWTIVVDAIDIDPSCARGGPANRKKYNGVVMFAERSGCVACLFSYSMM